jgi:hypothetical protein
MSEKVQCFRYLTADDRDCISVPHPFSFNLFSDGSLHNGFSLLTTKHSTKTRKLEIDKRNRLAPRQWENSFQDIFEKTQQESIIIVNIPLIYLNLIVQKGEKQDIKKLFHCPNCKKPEHPSRLCYHCHSCEKQDCDAMHVCKSAPSVNICPLCFYSKTPLI